MKLISRHNGRRFAEQKWTRRQRKKKSHPANSTVFHFLLTRKLLAHKKEKEGKYRITNKLTGSKAFQQQEALVSCSLFQNQAALCCSTSTETKKRKKNSFPQAKTVFTIVCVGEKTQCCDKPSAGISSAKLTQDHKTEVSFPIIKAKK